MSAPNPEKWKITEADWEEMVDQYGHWLELEKPIARISRRRALEELRALHAFMRDYGFAAEYVVRDRIAEIEAEAE